MWADTVAPYNQRMSRPPSPSAASTAQRLLPVAVAVVLAGGAALTWQLAGGPVQVGDPHGPWAWLPMLSFCAKDDSGE